MKIISAKYLYKDGEYHQNLAVAYYEKIEKIAPLKSLQQEFKDANILHYPKNSVIYPGFINPHVHLEFSANRATLNLGNFISWLNSVIEHREELVNRLTNDLIEEKANQMLRSGVTTFGAISSFGAELEVCKNLEQRVIFFNEIIGSNPAAVDTLFADFKARLQESISAKSAKLIPAIAIHSPYSVHPILIREVLKIAKKNNLITTAHFLESAAEREWLENGTGDFLEFFKNFSNTTKPINTISGFLELFKGHSTLFTHGTQATKEDLESLNRDGYSLIHCPRSNRLLGCGRAQIEYVDNLLLGTDGLSSNYSLSILEEMRAALMLHHRGDIKQIAQKLIRSITENAAKALQLNIGKIEPNYYADFAIFELASDLVNNDNGNLALHTILDCNEAKAIVIGGKLIE